MIFPKISIVTPTFNRADYLEETILSVLNQNYPNLEYIIIDGGSSDKTLEIINKYKNQISYWVSEPDRGMYHAIQKGFEKSTGEIMAWLNSDDKYHPAALNIVAWIFSEINEAEWIIGTPSLYNGNGDCVKVFPNTRWSKSRFWVGNYKWIQQETIFWRRSLWEKTGSTLNLSYRFAADFELWCRFFQFTRLFSVETILSGFRLHGNQVSMLRNLAYEEEVQEIVKYLKPDNSQFIRFLLLKCLCVLKNSLVKLHFQITNFFGSIFSLLIDKLHFYPPVIYYDFEKNKWRI